MTPTLLAVPLLVVTSSLLTQRIGEAAGADLDRELSRGREAIAAGRFDEASSLLDAIVRKRPDDALAWSLLSRARCGEAELRAAQGDDELPAAERMATAAEEAARKAIDLAQGSSEAWGALGHVLVRTGAIDEAIATLYHAERLAPPTAELLIDLADALFAAHELALAADDDAGAASRLAEAEAALDRADRLFDAHATVLRRRAEVRVAKGEPAFALADYRRAIHLAPGDLSLLEEHLKLAAKAERFDAAIDFCTGLVDEPSLSLWYRSRAREMRANYALKRLHDPIAAANDYLAAEQDFRACARADASLKEKVDAYLPSLRAYRGHALTVAERFADAEAALFAAVDLDPKHEAALGYLHELQDAMWEKFGGESMSKEQWETMRSFASKLATVEPDNAANWNNWGFFARETGKYEESYLAYRRALALEPDNSRYLNDTALILMYHLARDLERAQGWLEQAVEIAERDRHDEARADASRSEDEVTLGDAYGNLVNLLDGTGRKDEAIARLREFEQRLPKHSQLDHWKQKLLPDEWRAEQERKTAEAEAKQKAEQEQAGARAEDVASPDDEAADEELEDDGLADGGDDGEVE